MENKTYSPIQNHLPVTNHSSNSDTTVTSSTSSLFLSPIIHTAATTTTSSLQTLQTFPVTRSSQVYSDNTNNQNRSNRVITQPTFKRLLGESIKKEKFEDISAQEQYQVEKSKLTNIQSKTNNSQHPTVINSININPRETIDGLSAISMANVSAHIMSALNPTLLSDGSGAYFVTGLSNDITPNYKILPSSNSDIPSPSNSSNSSNPSSSNQHQPPTHEAKRHGEGNDPGRKREVRLQKNREAARECRRKKKEYIKCLEERVTGLENQNKALIEELRRLKELYCQREDPNNTTTNKTANTTR